MYKCGGQSKYLVTEKLIDNDEKLIKFVSKILSMIKNKKI